MRIHSLNTGEVLRRLVTSESGLSEAEAQKRFLESGPNEILETKKKPLIFKFTGQLTHFLAILLWIAAGLSFLSEYLHPGEGMLTLGLAIVGVIFINAVFTFVQEYKAERALEALRGLLPFRVKIIRAGKLKETEASAVVPGDLVLLAEGGRVPADMRLIETISLKVNNAPLTGESEAVALTDKPFDGDFLDSPNIAFAGASVVSGSGKGAVFATGMGTEFGRIAQLTSTVEPGLSPLQKEIIKVSRIVAFLATIMGAVFFIIGHFAGRTFWENYLFAIGIIVANVPEGLLPTVTLALAMGSQRMAKRKALIKTLTSVETLGSVSVICTDKTGTLTENKMTVKEIWSPDDSRPEAEQSLMRAAYLCNNARFTDGKYAGEPTEAAIFKTAREAIGNIEAIRKLEVPFDSDRKRMTTVNIIGNKSFAFTKGAVETVLPLCISVLERGEKVSLTEDKSNQIIAAVDSMTGKGLRVLALAYKKMSATDEEPERDMVFLGLMGLEDPPRPEVPEAIRRCREAGIKVIMFTGDASKTAHAIAREIGLAGEAPVIVEGRDFASLSDSELREKLSAKEIIFARMTPKHKMRVVSILKEEGERVAVTGDGVNDAPALKLADIGIAMGTGTDVAKEASDIVLLDDNFATIVNAVEEGRAVYENIRKFTSYIFSSNIPEIVPYLSYALLRIPLPLTIIQILSIDLGTDMLPALALGAEKPTADLMKKPPRGAKERLLNLRLLVRAYLFLGPIEALAGMLAFFYVLYGGGWSWGTALAPDNALYMQATTACLAAIIITQVGNVFACRSMTESVFRMGFFSNRLIFAGIASEVMLLLFIVYTPWGNEIFQTAPIAPGILLYLMPFALLLFFAEEARKLIARRMSH